MVRITTFELVLSLLASSLLANLTMHCILTKCLLHDYIRQLELFKPRGRSRGKTCAQCFDAPSEQLRHPWGHLARQLSNIPECLQSRLYPGGDHLPALPSGTSCPSVSLQQSYNL